MPLTPLFIVLASLVATTVGSHLSEGSKGELKIQGSPAYQRKAEALSDLLNKFKDKKPKDWLDEVSALSITSDEVIKLGSDGMLLQAHPHDLMGTLFLSDILSTLRTGRRIMHATHQVERLNDALSKRAMTYSSHGDQQLEALENIIKALTSSDSEIVETIVTNFPKIRAKRLRETLADHLIDIYVTRGKYHPEQVPTLANALEVKKEAIQQAHEEWIWEIFSDDTRILPPPQILGLIEKRERKNKSPDPGYQAINWMLLKAYRLRLDEKTKEQAITWIATIIDRLPYPPISLLTYFVKACPRESCKLVSPAGTQQFAEQELNDLLKKAYKKVDATLEVQNKLFFEREQGAIITRLQVLTMGDEKSAYLKELAEKAEETLPGEWPTDPSYFHPKYFINSFYKCSLDENQSNCPTFLCAASRVHWELGSVTGERCRDSALGGTAESPIAFLPTCDPKLSAYLETSTALARARVKDEEKFIIKLIQQLSAIENK